MAPSSTGSKSDNDDTMDEQRKHAILFAAALLCARKLLPLMESDEPKPAQEFLKEHFRWRAVEQARRLLEIIDKRWPAEKVGEPGGLT